MFQLGDKQPSPWIRALWAVLATLLCSCAQRTGTSSEVTAGPAGPGPDADMPEVVITAVREKPLWLAAEADSKPAPGEK